MLINFSIKELNMARHFKFISGLFVLFGVLFLSGCSTMRVIESQVQTSTQWPTGAAVPKQALFRWERLPADVNNAQAGWAEVELEAALAPLSWTRNDVDAQYSVWVGVRTAEFIADTWGRPVRGPWVSHLHFGVGSGYRPRGMNTNIGWSMGSPLYPGIRPGFPPAVAYAQEVSIIIRDLKSSQVVYQTKASHDGPWADHPNILRVMMGAALQGFPQPSVMSRRVDTTLSR